MNKGAFTKWLLLLAVLSWIRVYMSQDVLSIVASVVLTLALGCTMIQKR